MAFVFDTALQTAITNAATQVAKNAALNSNLGATRTITLTKDGTTFYSATMTGPISMERNLIFSYGVVKNTTVNNAADLSTGVCKLRISGNGHFMEGTLGLTAAGQTAAGITMPLAYDFMLPANPKAGQGLGFDKRVRTKLPPAPNGIGPLPPTLDANAPHTFEIYGVANGVETLAGSLVFDTPDESLLFADPEIASQMGETLVFKSSQSIVFDKFEFGAKFFASNPSLAMDGVTPLYRVLAGAKPINQGWTTYPASDTFVRTTMTLQPPAFRAKIKRADGSLLYTWQGHDGTPINDPSWLQLFTSSGPCRPFWIAGMMLPWMNTAARLSDYKNKFYSGVTTDSIRPSLAKFNYSSNGLTMRDDAHTNLDGLSHFYQMNQWPTKRDTPNDDQPLDPWMQPIATNSGHTYFEYLNGWDYEPGSCSGHDMMSGPGGVRWDRTVIATTICLYMTNQSFVRPKGNVPIRNIYDGWTRAYFNVPMYLFRDVKAFTGIPDNEIATSNCLWNHGNVYYGGTFGKGRDRTIDLCGVGNSGGRNSNNYDVNGNVFWAGYEPDYLHGYMCPGWVALLTCDPVFAIAQKHRYNAQRMCELDGQTDVRNDFESDFFSRQMAWRWLHRTMTWKLASGSYANHDRFELEETFRIALEALYDKVYVPTFLTPNQQDIRFVSLKNLGCVTNQGGSKSNIDSNGLSFYMSEVMILMKQTGLWSVLRQKNYKCSAMLGAMIYFFDKFTYDYLLDTPGVAEGSWGGYFPTAIAANGTTTLASDIPASWAVWQATVAQSTDPNVWTKPGGTGSTYFYLETDPSADWVTAPGGGLAERHESMHLRGGYALNRPVYFPEYTNPRMAAGQAKVQAYYDKQKNRLPASPQTYDGQTRFDFAFLTPPKGKRLPPSALGPV